MNDRAKLLANFYPSELSVSAYWYEDAIVLTLTTTEEDQRTWTTALEDHVLEAARSDDGSLCVLILAIPQGVHHPVVMDCIAAVAKRFGEKAMFQDNRQLDANTLDLWVEQIRRTNAQIDRPKQS